MGDSQDNEKNEEADFIRSVSDLIKLRKELGPSRWFRGQKQATWSLSPSIYR
jgi:hypothetical protein